MNCKEIHSNLDNYSYSENKKLAEVYSIWITEFKQWIPIKITLLLSDTISANSDTIIFTFAGSDTSSMRSLWNMHTLFFHERMQPWNVSLPWQRKQKWRPDDWSQFKMLSFPSPVVNQVLENLRKIHLHLKNIVLDLRDGALEKWEADLHRARSPHSLSSCLRPTGLEGHISPQRSLSAAPQWALWFGQRAQLYPLRNAFTNILCAGATGIKHRQPPGCPTFPFTLQHFKLLQAELPETVVNSWHWEFPWSQLARKKGFLFPPWK